MKYIYFACVCFALVAYISAKPVYSNPGPVYAAQSAPVANIAQTVGYRPIPVPLPAPIPAYAPGPVYAPRPAPVYAQPIVLPLAAAPASPRAAAAAAAAAAALNPGLYAQLAVPQYDIISGEPGPVVSNYGPISTY